MKAKEANKAKKKIAFFAFVAFIAFIAFPACAYLFHPLEHELEGGDWEWAEAQARKDPVFAAVVKMYQGRYAEALSALPGALDAKGEKLREYLVFLNDASGRFTEEISTAGFRIKMERRDLVLRDGAAAALSACRLRVKNLTGFEPKEEVRVEIYRRKKDFAVASSLGDELLKKSGVIGIAKFHRIMLITPEALAFGYAWQDSICHEYLHHSLKISAGMNVPLWFHEGFARFNEASWRGASLNPPLGDKEELMLAAKEGRLVLFERMEPSMVYLKDEAEISLAFTQVGLSLGPLSGHLDKFLELVRRGNFEKAFEKTYGKSLKEFEKEMWASWVQEAQGVKKSGALRTVRAMETNLDEEKIFLGPKAASLISLGDAMRARKNQTAALRLYRQAYDQEPANPYVLSRIARAQAALNQEEKALETAKKLIATNPEWPPGHELLGNLYESQGFYPEAIEAYAHYLDFNPYHKNLQKKIALLYLDLGENNKAKPYIERTLFLDPGDKEALEALQAADKKYP